MIPSPNATLLLATIPALIIGLAVWRSRISDDACDNSHSAGARSNQPSEESNIAGARRAIDLAGKPPETIEEATERRHREQITWTRKTVTWVGLYTALTAIIAYLGVRQLQITNDATDAAKTAAAAAKSSAEANVAQLKEMRASGRAWISPMTATLTRQISEGFPLAYSIAFANTGRDPALDVVYKVIPDATSNVPPITDWDAIKTPTNISCDSVYPKEGAEVAYPSGGGIASNTYNFGQNLRDFGLARLLFDAVANQTVVFVVNGCLAYRTIGEVHRSGFCFYLKPPTAKNGPDSTWQFKICPAGNHAD